MLVIECALEMDVQPNLFVFVTFFLYFSDWWMIPDTPIPRLNKLIIEGTLEVEEQGEKVVIEATYVYITGRLIVGWPDRPYQGEFEMILNGNHLTPDFTFDGDQFDGSPIGAKVLGTRTLAFYYDIDL